MRNSSVHDIADTFAQMYYNSEMGWATREAQETHFQLKTCTTVSGALLLLRAFWRNN